MATLYDDYIDLICKPLPLHWVPPTLVSLEAYVRHETGLSVAVRQQTSFNQLLHDFGIGKPAARKALTTFVLGDGGTGKSTLARFLAREARACSKPLLWLDANDATLIIKIARGAENLVKELGVLVVRRIELSLCDWCAACDRGDAIVVLDGVNEMLHQDGCEGILRSVADLAQWFPSKILVTSRLLVTDLFDSRYGIPGMRFLRLAEFDERQKRFYFEQHAAGHSQDFCAKVKSAGLWALASNPYLLELICKECLASDAPLLPSSRAELLLRFSERCRKEKLNRKTYSLPDTAGFLRLVSESACCALSNPTRTVSHQALSARKQIILHQTPAMVRWIFGLLRYLAF